MANILIIERDQFNACTAIDALAKLNWRITHFTDPATGLREAQKNTYALIIVGDTGKIITNPQICKRLRNDGIETPILNISNSYTVDDVVSVLEAGADAYLARPFSTRELAARCQALLKRTPRLSKPSIHIADMELDRQRRLLQHNGQSVYLRRREFEILLLLAENHDRVLTRSHINARTASNFNECDDNCIDVHISNIRKALQQYGCPDVIETVHGVGYKLKL